MFWKPVLCASGVLLLVLLGTAGRYGYHRDELYFRLLGQHLAWGYTDVPVGTPALARLFTTLLGDNLFALRVPSALSAALTVVLTAALARELGGGRSAQTLAAAGTAAGGFTLVTGHMLQSSVVDMAVWAAAILCAVRALVRRDGRWWIAFGVVCGAGLLNKHLITLLMAGLLTGLLTVGPRRVLADRWVWCGAAVALLLALPTLVHQAAHGWPQLQMARALADRYGAANRTGFVPEHVLLLGLAQLPVWIAGLVGLFRRQAWRPVRALGVAYGVVVAIVLVSGGRQDYAAPVVIALYGAGCVPVAAWLARDRHPAVRVPVWSAASLSTAGIMVVTLPLLPLELAARTPIPRLNVAMREQIGWPAYVDQVAGVFRSLPPADRRRAVILTENYGEAAALDLFGRGLPPAYSGHVELYHLGKPPPGATIAVTVGMRPAELATVFRACSVKGRLADATRIRNLESGAPLMVCEGPRGPWARLWPRLRHLD